MEAIYFQTIFDCPIKEFKSHLEKEMNQRIVFSGKYGSGKTTFLNSFFESENQKKYLESDKYDAYHLFPINYSIANNEDIIKYIKYDLIIQLLQKAASIEEISLEFIRTLPEFIKKNLHKVAAIIVSMVPVIGKDISESYEKIDALKEKFLTYHDKANESSGDVMIKYLDQLQNQSGSIYENDVITKIISNTIKKHGKKAVLIVDDLDRLDPEHVFRILNVFAAHFDDKHTNGTNNKFGFEKIILVCDFKNIRRLFHYKYGEEVDFMGYVDKFYSSDVYHFDNNSAVVNIIKDVFNSIRYPDYDHPDPTVKELINAYYFGNGFLENTIQLMLSNRFISLRNIIKIYHYSLNYHIDKINFSEINSKVDARLFPFTLQLKILTNIVGDFDNLKVILTHFANSSPNITNYKKYFFDLIPILSLKEWDMENHGRHVLNFESKDIVIKIRRDFQRAPHVSDILELSGYDKNKEIVEGPPFIISVSSFWNALLSALKILNSVGYIR
jgi:hypothetical protein